LPEAELQSVGFVVDLWVSRGVEPMVGRAVQRRSLSGPSLLTIVLTVVAL